MPADFSNVSFVDNPAHKRVEALLFDQRRHVTLWQGAAYDAAGDWTQAQAEERLRELLSDPS
jgi:hypothetical protein